jgi:hypothetical protein
MQLESVDQSRVVVTEEWFHCIATTYFVPSLLQSIANLNYTAISPTMQIA